MLPERWPRGDRKRRGGYFEKNVNPFESYNKIKLTKKKNLHDLPSDLSLFIMRGDIYSSRDVSWMEVAAGKNVTNVANVTKYVQPHAIRSDVGLVMKIRAPPEQTHLSPGRC